MHTIPEWVKRHSRKKWGNLTLEAALAAHAGMNQMSRKEQAAALGFSAPFLTMVLKGRPVPKARRSEIAEALGVPESVLDNRDQGENSN